MAIKPVIFFPYATNANYVGGPFPGTPTKTVPPHPDDGWIPSEVITAETDNYLKNVYGQWNEWAFEGSSAPLEEPAIVERDAVGTVGLAAVSLGGTFSADTALQVGSNSGAPLASGFISNSDGGFGLIVTTSLAGGAGLAILAAGDGVDVTASDPGANPCSITAGVNSLPSINLDQGDPTPDRGTLNIEPSDPTAPASADLWLNTNFQFQFQNTTNTETLWNSADGSKFFYAEAALPNNYVAVPNLNPTIILTDNIGNSSTQPQRYYIKAEVAIHKVLGIAAEQTIQAKLLIDGTEVSTDSWVTEVPFTNDFNLTMCHGFTLGPGLAANLQIEVVAAGPDWEYRRPKIIALGSFNL